LLCVFSEHALHLEWILSTLANSTGDSPGIQNFTRIGTGYILFSLSSHILGCLIFHWYCLLLHMQSAYFWKNLLFIHWLSTVTMVLASFHITLTDFIFLLVKL
jgi:hypothetical protein